MELPRVTAFLADPATAALEREVNEELACHLELAREELERSGCTAAEAARRARERFGDLDHIRRECLRARSGGNLLMKILLILSNALLLAALLTSLLFMRALHARNSNALRESQSALAAAEHARAALGQSLARTPQPVESIVIEVGDTLEVVDQHRSPRFGPSTRVQADGKALLNDVGWVHVAGKTRESVEAELKQALLPFYADEADQLKVFVIVDKPR